MPRAYDPLVAVEILYCPVWSGYDERAASLAAELSDTGLEASIREGAKSQFDVFADGELLRGPAAEGRWP